MRQPTAIFNGPLLLLSVVVKLKADQGSGLPLELHYYYSTTVKYGYNLLQNRLNILFLVFKILWSNPPTCPFFSRLKATSPSSFMCILIWSALNRTLIVIVLLFCLVFNYSTVPPALNAYIMHRGRGPLKTPIVVL